jgi:hypothetical protein
MRKKNNLPSQKTSDSLPSKNKSSNGSLLGNMVGNIVSGFGFGTGIEASKSAFHSLFDKKEIKVETNQENCTLLSEMIEKCNAMNHSFDDNTCHNLLQLFSTKCLEK